MNERFISARGRSSVRRMATIASTSQGKLEGVEESGLRVFKGIPFAAPPVGGLRWMPPQKPKAWNGVRSAKAFGSAAPQPTLPTGFLAAFTIDEPQSEDCLYLNVWTPGLDGGRRPVLVWIHGGGFEIGAGSQRIYDGVTLARRGDVVVVSINYRLGPLGFLRLVDATNGAIPSHGNEGLLDQVCALEWVRDNIAEFGGDPGNVTIFGESAGGISVGSLLGLPAARGLFHKAIPQSGASHLAHEARRASDFAARVVRRAGCSAGDADALRALSAEAVMAASPNMLRPDPEIPGIPFAPVIDGKVLPRRPIESVAAGAANDVAVLVGATRDEWRLFGLMDPQMAGLDEDGLRRRVGRYLGNDKAEALIGAYRSSRQALGEPCAPSDLLAAVETDRIFGVPALRLAQAQSAHQEHVFRYLFTWKSPAMGGILGACHALELGFVFGVLEQPGMAEFSGRGEAAEALARGLQDAWLAFARTGDPSCETVGSWPKFQPEAAPTMLLGAKFAVENAPFDSEMRQWADVPHQVMAL
jgi:para-nitrobenzyl esterase